MNWCSMIDTVAKGRAMCCVGPILRKSLYSRQVGVCLRYILRDERCPSAEPLWSEATRAVVHRCRALAHTFYRGIIYRGIRATRYTRAYKMRVKWSRNSVCGSDVDWRRAAQWIRHCASGQLRRIRARTMLMERSGNAHVWGPNEVGSSMRAC